MVDKKVIGTESPYGPIEFDLHYQSPNAYPIVNSMILIKEEDQSDIPSFAETNRKSPVFVANNSAIKNDNVYHLPDGFQIDFVPSSYSLSSDLMDVFVNYLKKDSTVEIHSLYRTKRSVIPPERYSQLRDFRKDLFKKTDQYVVLKKSFEVSTEAKDWVKKQ